ncbi:TPA: hypothetical protein ACJEU7_001230 [Acinetobacter baumannii]|uniref:hypothetical protein n=1 Tax=Acinetobacter baumannii TaxID=470 RepID=UPI002259DC51|nr:hypothetical protein [Acinetobacter baumannii]MCX3035315.1 hypothetical protein [Acinetobacter baumannii]
MLPFLILAIVINIALLVSHHKQYPKMNSMKAILCISLLIFLAFLGVDFFNKKANPSDEISPNKYQFLLLNACFNSEYTQEDRQNDLIFKINKDLLSDGKITNLEFNLYHFESPLQVPYGVSNGNLQLAKHRLKELSLNVSNRIYLEENNIEINEDNYHESQKPIVLCSSYQIRYSERKKTVKTII